MLRQAEVVSGVTDQEFSDILARSERTLESLLQGVVPHITDPVLIEKLSGQIAALQGTLSEISKGCTAIPAAPVELDVSTVPQRADERVKSTAGGDHIEIRENQKIIDTVVEQTAGRLGALERRIQYGRSVQVVLERIAVSEDGALLQELAGELKYHGGISADKVLSVSNALHLTQEQGERFYLTDAARRLLS